MSSRSAIYFAPAAESELWAFGSALIGYDAASGESPDWPADLPADRETWSSWTAEPRTYGFHATLKAPFRLAAGATDEDLDRLAADLARRWRPFGAGPLALRLLGAFAALVPDEPSRALEDFAAACVEAFEPVRAPLSDTERARRLRAPLTPRQTELLDRYGYPYVLDEFRFHMTLSGKLPPERAEEVRARLADRYRPLAAELRVDAICVFVQPAPGERFRIRRRFPLGS